MPPKPKFTKDEIVAAALGVVSKKGADALTAKQLGDALGSSARPIFTVFNSMKEVQDEVYAAAMRLFESYADQMELQMQDMPLFKRVGMQMVLFGAREPKLYQLLFMQEERSAQNFDDVFRNGGLGATVDVCLEAIQKDYALSENAANQLFKHMWIYTFGVGALCATRVREFSEQELGEMLSVEFQALITQIKQEQ